MILDMITRLPGLTVVDGSISPLEELDDSTKGTRKVAWGQLVVLIDWFRYNASGFIFIPWSYTSPSQLRLTRIILLNLDDFGLKSPWSPSFQRLLPYSATITFRISRSVLPVSWAKICRPPEGLPNANFAECRSNIFTEWTFLQHLALAFPDFRALPKSGVNTCPLNFGIKWDSYSKIGHSPTLFH